MRRHTYLIAPVALIFSIFATLPAEVEAASCKHGSTLLQNDTQAWLSLYNQNARLYKNVTHIRTEINYVIVMNVVAHDIEKQIHHLEHSVKIDGFNLSDVDLTF